MKGIIINNWMHGFSWANDAPNYGWFAESVKLFPCQISPYMVCNVIYIIVHVVTSKSFPGHTCEQYNNPADFFLDVIQDTSVGQCMHYTRSYIHIAAWLNVCINIHIY